MPIMLRFKGSCEMAVWARHAIGTCERRLSFIEVAKDRCERFAVRADYSDIPFSSSERYGKHWGRSLFNGRGSSDCQDPPTRILSEMIKTILLRLSVRRRTPACHKLKFELQTLAAFTKC